MKNIFAICLFASVGFISEATSQVLKPATWEVLLREGEVEVGGEAVVEFNVKIDKDWYLYSSDFDPDLGPMVTEIVFEAHESYELLGGIIPQDPKKKYDSLWEGEYTYFKDQGTFIQKIRVLKKEYNISGSYLYQVCSDVDGKCIPFEDDFEISSTGSNTKTVAVPNQGKKTKEGSLWTLIIVSFLAGVAAVLMPCVYPLIPVTVSIFLKQSANKKEGIKKAIIYGLSIIVMFSAIGFLVSLIWGFSSLNALSTNWIFNISLFALLVVFALSFLGLFEINLPSSFVTKIDRQADKGGYIGIFFMAATLVVVSFSCTVPIVGTAIFTLTNGDVLRGTLSMFAFSMAFAIPFTAFAFFPSWLNTLPKSGGWMTTLKAILGFLELALALKFLSVADLAYHWGILDREVFIAAWIVIFALLGFYLLGKVRLPHDMEMKTVPVPRLIGSIVVFSFVIYLIPGLIGAPLKSLAGFLPPLSTHDFNLIEIVRDQNDPGNHRNRETSTILCEPPKYADFLELPYGIEGYFDLDQAIACASKSEKPIFIDFTGWGCVNCREMEQKVWSDPEVLRRLKNDFVVLALYVDDKTTLPESEWIKSDYDQKWKKQIGQKNANFQITKFNNNAQPFYVILDKEGNLIEGPQAYDLDVSHFVSFLERGKSKFNKPSFISEATN